MIASAAHILFDIYNDVDNKHREGYKNDKENKDNKDNKDKYYYAN